jgi:hypothetical protein
MILLRQLRALVGVFGLACIFIASLDTPASPSNVVADSHSLHSEEAHAHRSSSFPGLRGARRQLLIHPNAIPVGLKGGGEHARIKCFWVR